MYIASRVVESVHREFPVQELGPHHVVIGRDSSFDMRHYDPLGQIDGVRGLSQDDKDLIRSATAAKLLKLEG